MSAARPRAVPFSTFTVVAALLLVALPIAQAPSGAAQPTASVRAEALLPSPFKVEYRETADLDGDGDLDVVIVGVDGDVPAPEESGPDDGEGDRVLLFARKDPDGYRRLGLGKTAVMCRRCGGAFWGGIPAPIDLTVAKPSGSKTVPKTKSASSKTSSSIVVEQTAGAREVTTWVHRYRFEQGRVRLIGVDVTLVDRATGGSWTTSTNELTGITITTVSGDVDNAPKAGTSKRAPRFVSVDAVDLTD
jgi:hypothetical protein